LDRRIRILGAALVVCFVVLFFQLNNLQLLQASKLAKASGNPRTVLQNVAEPRGDIQTADGVVVAESLPTHDSYHYLRYYPDGPLYSAVVGFDSILYGLFGVEETYNSYLTAHTASIRSISDLFRNRTTTDTVTLTISSKLQALAASLLAGRNGSVVVMIPQTGAILAMYNNPTFNPNLLASHNLSVERKAWQAYLADPSQPLLARSYRQRYAPGSTFKIVTASAIFDHDPRLARKVYPAVSEIPLPDTTHLLHNYAYEACGGGLAVMFAVSCDTGFAQLGLALGAKALAEEAQSFGFNSVPPIDLPAPAVSYFPPASSFANNLPGLAYSAIGQENVSASALQMAMVASAIADGGKMMTPHVMAEITGSSGQVVLRYRPRLWRRATSSSTAKAVTKLMEGVTQPGGTAPNVAIPGIEVAAKTGTAQEGLNAALNNDWLVAFAPAQNPKVAVAVVVPGAPGETVGATTAGPIARAMLIAALGEVGGT